MNKVNLTPNKAVNMEKTLKSGFFAVTASLCGLLAGSTGCSAPTPVSTLTFATGAKMLKDHIQKQSAGDQYPRLIEPQFLARLDGNRQAIPMPDPNNPAGEAIPTNAVPQADLWDTACLLYTSPSPRD